MIDAEILEKLIKFMVTKLYEQTNTLLCLGILDQDQNLVRSDPRKYYRHLHGSRVPWFHTFKPKCPFFHHAYGHRIT